MGNLGGMEIVVILLVALVVLGPTKLPEAARQVGKAVTELRRISGGFQRELRDAMEEPVVESEARARGKELVENRERNQHDPQPDDDTRREDDPQPDDDTRREDDPEQTSTTIPPIAPMTAVRRPGPEVDTEASASAATPDPPSAPVEEPKPAADSAPGPTASSPDDPA